MKLSDINKPWARNPRKISTEQLKGLGNSMSQWGDLSQIVFNTRNNSLVCGHQRLRNLVDAAGDADPELIRLDNDSDCGVLNVGGEAWNIRLVDWDDETHALAANAANSEALMGEWDEAKLEELIQEASKDELFSAVRMDELAESLSLETSPDDDDDVKLKPLDPGKLAPPKMTWALFGIPTVRFGEASQLIEQLAEIPDSVIELAVNDDDSKLPSNEGEGDGI